MKYKWKRYWLWITILTISIATLVWLTISGVIKTDVFLGILAAVLTLFITVIGYYKENDQFFKELFTEFNTRYDKMYHFLNQVKETGELNGEGKQRVIDYLNLCAEEYMWVRKGRLPEDIWKSWKNGILFHLKKEPIKKIFEEERSFWKSSYYGLFDDIDIR